MGSKDFESTIKKKKVIILNYNIFFSLHFDVEINQFHVIIKWVTINQNILNQYQITLILEI